MHLLRALLIAPLFAGWSPLLAATVVEPPAPERAPLPDGLYATWHTAHGSFTAELFSNETPLTVANFVGLAEGSIPFEADGRTAGTPYFDGLTFHRVVPDFVVQGGDPLGNGEGGPGYTFADEFSPRLKHDGAGVLAMANSGPATNGSQFYFTLSEVNRLNYKHTVFGRVVRGLEVLPQIAQGDAMTRVEIVRVGPAALAYRVDASRFAGLRTATRVIPPRDTALSPQFADTAGLDLPEWAGAWINEKLHHYAVVRDIRIWVRTVPKFSTPPADAGTTNPLRHLHITLAGTDARAATLIYIADEKTWRIWIADGLLPLLSLAPDELKEEPGRKRLHAIKQGILSDAKAALLEPEARPGRSINAAITALLEALDATEGSVR